MKKLTLSLKETKNIAEKVAKLLKLGDTITLNGNLGAGKTSFSQFLIRKLAGDTAEVTSPTFNLLHIYEASAFQIWHFDLYRIKKINEAYELGIEEAFDNKLVLIEWPEIIKDILPRDRLEIEINFTENENERMFIFHGFGEWKERLKLIEDYL